jgi:hypothetical protein
MRCGDLIGGCNGTGDFGLEVSETKLEATLHKLVEIVTRQPTVCSRAMSNQLPLVSQVMYFRDGEVEPGDEAKVERLERKLWD